MTCCDTKNNLVDTSKCGSIENPISKLLIQGRKGIKSSNLMEYIKNQPVKAYFIDKNGDLIGLVPKYPRWRKLLVWLRIKKFQLKPIEITFNN